MRILIYGCTRLTDALAPVLAHDGHEITAMGSDSDRLAILAKQTQVATVWMAEPLMQDYLMMGGIEGSGAFLALSGSDHRNLLMSQIATEIYNVPRVLCYLADPQLQDLFQPIGVNVLSGGADVLSAAREFLEQ